MIGGEPEYIVSDKVNWNEFSSNPNAIHIFRKKFR